MHSSLHGLLLLVAVLLFVHAAAPQACDFTLGTFQVNALVNVALEKKYFKKEGINNLCIDLVLTSLDGHTKLNNGLLDTFETAWDNTYFRHEIQNPPDPISVAAAGDMGHGYVLLGHNDLTLATLSGKTYAADSPRTGFIPIAYEMARLAGSDLSTISNVSGFSNFDRNSLANGDTVRGQTAHFALQALIWGLPEFYEPQWPNLITLGRVKDYIWPLQGSVFTVRKEAQSNAPSFQKLRRFFRALLRAYDFATKKNHRSRVIDIIEERTNITRSLASQIYELTIGAIPDLAGAAPFLVPSRRGLFNQMALRFNQQTGPAPGGIDLDAGAEKLVDLRALDAALDDLNLGDAFECYDSNLLVCG